MLRARILKKEKLIYLQLQAIILAVKKIKIDLKHAIGMDSWTNCKDHHKLLQVLKWFKSSNKIKQLQLWMDQLIEIISCLRSKANCRLSINILKLFLIQEYSLRMNLLSRVKQVAVWSKSMKVERQLHSLQVLKMIHQNSQIKIILLTKLNNKYLMTKIILKFAWIQALILNSNLVELSTLLQVTMEWTWSIIMEQIKLNQINNSLIHTIMAQKLVLHQLMINRIKILLLNL